MAVATPKEPGAVERSRHDLTHSAVRELVCQLRGRTRDDPPPQGWWVFWASEN